MQQDRLIGTQIMGYTVEEILGSGSFGNVYKVVKTNLSGSYVRALKHISVPTQQQYEALLNSLGGDHEQVERYIGELLNSIISEIRILSTLSETGARNIVRYYENDIIPDRPAHYDVFIMMEFLEPLDAYIRNSECFTVGNAAHMAMNILNGLSLCHENGIIHRDVKIDNIFVSNKGEYKIGDFGVSKIVSDETRASSIKGAPNFLAPEIYLGRGAYTNSVDLYSLGIVLYRLLNYNRNPFLPPFPEIFTAREEQLAFSKRISGHLPPAPALGGAAIGAVVLKAISGEKERYQTALEFRSALEQAIRETTPEELSANVKEYQADKSKPVPGFDRRATRDTLKKKLPWTNTKPVAKRNDATVSGLAEGNDATAGGQGRRHDATAAGQGVPASDQQGQQAVWAVPDQGIRPFVQRPIATSGPLPFERSGPPDPRSSEQGDQSAPLFSGNVSAPIQPGNGGSTHQDNISGGQSPYLDGSGGQLPYANSSDAPVFVPEFGDTTPTANVPPQPAVSSSVVRDPSDLTLGSRPAGRSASGSAHPQRTNKGRKQMRLNKIPSNSHVASDRQLYSGPIQRSGSQSQPVPQKQPGPKCPRLIDRFSARNPVLLVLPFALILVIAVILVFLLSPKKSPAPAAGSVSADGQPASSTVPTRPSQKFGLIKELIEPTIAPPDPPPPLVVYPELLASVPGSDKVHFVSTNDYFGSLECKAIAQPNMPGTAQNYMVIIQNKGTKQVTISWTGTASIANSGDDLRDQFEAAPGSIHCAEISVRDQEADIELTLEIKDAGKTILDLSPWLTYNFKKNGETASLSVHNSSTHAVAYLRCYCFYFKDGELIGQDSFAMVDSKGKSLPPEGDLTIQDLEAAQGSYPADTDDCIVLFTATGYR